MSDKLLEQIAHNIANIEIASDVEVRFDDATHNMLFYSLEMIAVQLKRIADKMEAGQ
mgnify:CR=1 FL=1